MDSAGKRPPGPRDPALAAEVAAGLERLIGLFRWLSPPSGLSLTAAATLATLERSGPRRLTALAAREGVTQPAMTQLVARLQDAGLVERAPDPADGRVVQVGITAEGQALLAGRGRSGPSGSLGCSPGSARATRPRWPPRCRPWTPWPMPSVTSRWWDSSDDDSSPGRRDPGDE